MYRLDLKKVVLKEVKGKKDPKGQRNNNYNISDIRAYEDLPQDPY